MGCCFDKQQVIRTPFAARPPRFTMTPLLREYESILFRQCADAYDRMLQESQESIWSGHVVAFFDGSTNYIKVIRALKAMKCIRQLQRGGRGVASTTMYELRYPPTYDLFNKHCDSDPNSQLTRAQLYSMIIMLQKRVTFLEEHYGRLMEGRDA